MPVVPFVGKDREDWDQEHCLLFHTSKIASYEVFFKCKFLSSEIVQREICVEGNFSRRGVVQSPLVAGEHLAQSRVPLCSV